MANRLRWFSYSDSVVDKYRVYRAITGIKVVFPNSLSYGDQLVFAATSQTQQVVRLTGGDIDTVIQDINTQGKGVVASKSGDNLALYIRCTATEDPRFKLIRCSFATKTGQLPRVVGPRSEYVSIGDLCYVNGTYDYTYIDDDGSVGDWYCVTSIRNNIESLPSQALRPTESFNETCAVVGRVMSLGNKPVPGAEVTASLMGDVGVNSADQSLISEEKFSCFSDEAGRWTLQLTRGQLVLLEIPSIGYNEVVKVPSLEYALFKDLVPMNDHYFNPTGEQAP